MSANYRCCSCSCSINCDGDTPCSWTLTVDGVDYVVRRPTRGTPDLGPQGWNRAGPFTYRGCTFEYLELGLEADGDLTAFFVSPSTGAVVTWQAVAAGNPFDCTANRTLPYAFAGAGTSGCTISGTPGTMTAVPSRFKDCGGSSSATCPLCDGGSGPSRYRVTIAGLVDSLCTACDAHNATYYLDFLAYAGPPINACHYGLFGLSAPYCANQVLLTRYPTSMIVTLPGGGGSVNFTKGGLTGDCASEITGFTAAPSGICDVSAATCTVTPV